jgi:acyl-coenzyme A thioesterase PaaI-like protein
VFVTCESWAVGDDAAKRGLDLRYFYRERARTGSSEYPELVGVARVGDAGAIGVHTYNLAHGGCIETILDETTAELVKCWRAPCCVTVELNAKIKKPVPLHHTVKIEAQIKEVQSNGLRIWTTAKLTDPSAPRGEDVLATCEAQLCDGGMLNRMRA